MAAIIAITLYMELPRLAMQAQRDKEQTLIDRGEQYKRAIQLFVAKAKRYPGDIKELESFQNQRFLRHRYEDPMTGKEEWRLIHIQNGILTDSKLTKPAGPGGDKQPSGPNGFVGELAGLGATQNNLPGGAASQRDRRRASDSNNATMPGPAVPGGDLSGGQNSGATTIPGQTPDNGQLPQTSANGQPGQLPGQQGFPGQTGMPGMPGMPGRGVPTNTTNTSNTTSGNSFVGGGSSFVGGGGSYVGGGSVTGSQPANPGQTGYPGQQPGMYPGQTLPGQPGAPVNSQGGGVSPYPIQAGSNGTPPGFPQPGTAPGQGNAAADMIRNILTTPRPGGMPQGIAGAQTIGGGIAGVATTAEGEGVKVYNDRTLYQEWEFIFDPTKQKRIPNPNATGAGGTPAGSMNQGTQPQNTTTPGSSPSQFGPQTSSPFGRPPGQ